MVEASADLLDQYFHVKNLELIFLPRIQLHFPLPSSSIPLNDLNQMPIPSPPTNPLLIDNNLDSDDSSDSDLDSTLMNPIIFLLPPMQWLLI